VDRGQLVPYSLTHLTYSLTHLTYSLTHSLREMTINKEFEVYMAVIKKDYVIPYDETAFDTKSLRSATKARLDVVPKLAGDSAELGMSKSKLESKMAIFDEEYGAKNGKQVEEAVQALIDHDLEADYAKDLVLTHSPTHSLTYSLTHLLTHSPNHLLRKRNSKSRLMMSLSTRMEPLQRSKTV